MSETRDNETASPSSPADGASLMASGGLVVAILAIFVLTAFLRTDPPRLDAGEPADSPAASLAPPLAALPLEEPPPVRRAAPSAPEPRVDPVLARIAARVEADVARATGASDRWTAQLMLARDPASVERMLSKSGGDKRLFVLPAEDAGEPRFRVCWGLYKTAKDAAAASDLPAALRSGGKPLAKPVAKVLPS